MPRRIHIVHRIVPRVRIQVQRLRVRHVPHIRIGGREPPHIRAIPARAQIQQACLGIVQLPRVAEIIIGCRHLREQVAKGVVAVAHHVVAKVIRDVHDVPEAIILIVHHPAAGLDSALVPQLARIVQPKHLSTDNLIVRRVILRQRFPVCAVFLEQAHTVVQVVRRICF